MWKLFPFLPSGILLIGKDVPSHYPWIIMFLPLTFIQSESHFFHSREWAQQLSVFISESVEIWGFLNIISPLIMHLLAITLHWCTFTPTHYYKQFVFADETVIKDNDQYSRICLVTFFVHIFRCVELNGNFLISEAFATLYVMKSARKDVSDVRYRCKM